MNSSSKIVINTAVLYGQLLVGMALGLYTTRLVLNALGETDFGIYMLVAGVVGMLGVLNSNMSNTSMRFMAHSLGSENIELSRKTFNTTLFLHFVIGLIVVLIMEIVGVYLIFNVLNIPPEKVFEASIVFHFMVLTTFVTIIAVPYDAVMNSHENLSALAIVDIIGNILKLAIAICLTYIDTNLLVTYGLLMFLVQISQRIIKQVYSKRKYDECEISFKKHVDRKMMREILSFTGWNLFGSIAAMSVNQIRTILINMFFGVKLNAAEGIAKKASSTVNMVSSSMSRAINPQLMKSEGSGDRNRMIKITEIGTKFSAFLFALFAVPVLLEAPYLLKIWLKNVPDFTVVFFQLLLLSMLIEKFSFQITHSIRAIGKIKVFQLTETAIFILVVPLAYLAFHNGYPPVSFYIIGLCINFLIFFERLYFGKKIADIAIMPFIKNAIIPILIPTIISSILALCIRLLFDANIIRLLIVSVFYILTLTALFWFMGINQYERTKLKGVYISILSKIKK